MSAISKISELHPNIELKARKFGIEMFIPKEVVFALVGRRIAWLVKNYADVCAVTRLGRFRCIMGTRIRIPTLHTQESWLAKVTHLPATFVWNVMEEMKTERKDAAERRETAELRQLRLNRIYAFIAENMRNGTFSVPVLATGMTETELSSHRDEWNLYILFIDTKDGRFAIGGDRDTWWFERRKAADNVTDTRLILVGKDKNNALYARKHDHKRSRPHAA